MRSSETSAARELKGLTEKLYPCAEEEKREEHCNFVKITSHTYCIKLHRNLYRG